MKRLGLLFALVFAAILTLLGPLVSLSCPAETITATPVYRGTIANAATKPADHQMNRNPSVPGWGGCVPSSCVIAMRKAGVPKVKIERFWALAQRRVGVGGTTPQMLAEMLAEAMPDEPWVSYLGPDTTVADRLNGKGYVVCSTMAWGELYGNRRIAHMVAFPHWSRRDDLACLEDNNDPPGVYRWFSEREAAARALGSTNQAWFVAFTRKHPLALAGFSGAAALVLAALCFGGAARVVQTTS